MAFTPTFTLNSKETNAPLKFNGNDVDLILGKIWSPSFTIGNEIQPREIQNRSVQAAPNGWVRVYEQFNFNFFIPLFIIFVAAAAVTWIDPTQTAPHTAPRVLGTIILILTTITLKFALAREISAVNYITLTDAVFGITVLILIVSLIMSCAIIFLKEYMHKDVLSKKLNISFRKIYPLLYLASICAVFLVFYKVNWNA